MFTRVSNFMLQSRRLWIMAWSAWNPDLKLACLSCQWYIAGTEYKLAEWKFYAWLLVLEIQACICFPVSQCTKKSWYPIRSKLPNRYEQALAEGFCTLLCQTFFQNFGGKVFWYEYVSNNGRINPSVSSTSRTSLWKLFLLLAALSKGLIDLKANKNHWHGKRTI